MKQKGEEAGSPVQCVLFGGLYFFVPWAAIRIVSSRIEVNIIIKDPSFIFDRKAPVACKSLERVTSFSRATCIV